MLGTNRGRIQAAVVVSILVLLTGTWSPALSPRDGTPRAPSLPAPLLRASAASPTGQSARPTPSAHPSIIYGNWSDLSGWSSSTPSARQAVSFAYDPLLNAVILFGGQDSGGSPLGDTWEYVDGNWTDLTSTLSSAPAARWGSGLTYDPQLESLVLFGGGGYQRFNDTWALNASGSTNLTATLGLTVAPPQGPGETLVWDSTDHYLLLS